MKRKKMIIGTSSIFVLLIIVLLGGSQYMLNYSLRPENRGKNLESSWQYMFNLKSASNLNGNLNCSKELEHYAS